MIYTFYSYKGGVGRSMAIANVAKWYYLQRLRVVVIDWDLEAPGLENFFFNRQEDPEAEDKLALIHYQLGLINLLRAYKRQFPRLSISPEDKNEEKVIESLNKYLPPISDMLYPIYQSDDPSGPALWLLPAGLRSSDDFADYSRTVQSFDWIEFFVGFQGKAYFEWMRRQLLNEGLADVVLIDSRTGVTEMGGVCTRQLADVVVSFCVPNVQNIVGVTRMVESFQHKKVIEARGGRHLDNVVVPTRLESSEIAARNRFKDQFLDTFKPYRPDPFHQVNLDFWDLQIPYVPKYAYDEILAVGVKDRAEEMEEAYVNLATALVLLAPRGSVLRTKIETVLQSRFRVLSEVSDKYVDFELELEPLTGGEYQISVLRSPAGQTTEPIVISFPYSDLDLRELRSQLENELLRLPSGQQLLFPELPIVRDFGRSLFDSIFIGEVRSLYYESREIAVRDGLRLRLKLSLQSPEFATLPWEYLYEPRTQENVSLSRSHSLVRYLPQARTTSPLITRLPLRILGMVASPKDMAQIDVDSEKQLVEQALGRLQEKGMVELHWLQEGTAIDLQRALRREQWHILHFIGQGNFDPERDEGVIWLADMKGLSQPLTATQLGRLVSDHLSLRLMVLNAAGEASGIELDVFSSTAATLIQRGVPAVLAIQYDISDNAAMIFTEIFYESLVDGLQIDAAVTEARKAISLDDVPSIEWGTPALYMGAIDSHIFDLSNETIA